MNTGKNCLAVLKIIEACQRARTYDIGKELFIGVVCGNASGHNDACTSLLAYLAAIIFSKDAVQICPPALSRQGIASAILQELAPTVMPEAILLKELNKALAVSFVAPLCAACVLRLFHR